MKRIFVATTLIAGALSTRAEEVPLQHAWYQVELVLFERPETPIEASAEELFRPDDHYHPLSSLAFDDEDGRGHFYRLDAATLATPARPPVDLDYLAALGLVPREEQLLEEPNEAASTEVPDPALPAIDLAPPREPTAREVLAEATARFEEDLVQRSFKWLAPSAPTLVASSRRLANRDGYRVLLHGAWIQPVPPREMPQQLLIQAGDDLGDRFRVEGTISVTVARFLHLAVDLGYQPAAPIRPDVASSTGDLRFVEQRRMRSAELHYLDHPRLGLIARIDAVEPPAELKAMAEAID